MAKIYVINNTGRTLFIIRQVGTSWGPGSWPDMEIPSNGQVHLAGTIDDETAGHSSYGWLPLGLDRQDAKWQLYVWLRKVQTDDYAVQLFGDDKNDKTLPDTIAEKHGSDITFTLNFAAPPLPPPTLFEYTSARLGDVNDIDHFAEKNFPELTPQFLGMTREQMIRHIVVACEAKPDVLRQSLDNWIKS